MSDKINHECGLALLRLRKDLSFYADKYGTPLYGLHKMYLLMEKQHNRGQDGAGLGAVQLDMPHGHHYIHRSRFFGTNALQHVFADINNSVRKVEASDAVRNIASAKNECGYAAELFLGHLRYGKPKSSTPGYWHQNSTVACHPFHRRSNWKTRNLLVAGNFNLTNCDQIYEELVKQGQHPFDIKDGAILMERLAFYLDMANEKLHQELSVIDKDEQDHLNVTASRRLSVTNKTNRGISDLIASRLDLQDILQQASHDWDGGYVISAVFGHGDACVLRDPHGIRPAWYYVDDEVVVVASERPPIQTAFNLPTSSVKEIPPGCALIIRLDNTVQIVKVQDPLKLTACSFERIYFARPNDEDIHQEREALGRYLCNAVLEAVNYDIPNSVFSFIPNSAETAFVGLVQGLNQYLKRTVKQKILALGDAVTAEALDEILSLDLRTERVAIKDQKLRTFIMEDVESQDVVEHVYDITYGVVREGKDILIALDDSIVRGMTMRCSLLPMFNRLKPKEVIICSSAPQIRYPDCYGIDMAQLGEFVAFRAAVALLKAYDMSGVLEEVYQGCVQQDKDEIPDGQRVNLVKKIYAPFTNDQLSTKIAELLTPPCMECPVKIIYQRVEDVHRACPSHKGDWYFTGDYPTPGGAKICNRAYKFWYEQPTRTLNLNSVESFGELAA
jgi:amidophosphoribosyltransferase|mmetsp:Transcript_4452/g.8196  ORF Transcript_4452/g.8196 Transcript_4452/m.8196 type:complete len:673 (-) Transcript_4452:1200-3218(-)|eukprot:CAMPEP_0174304152 /NCGR_PEP_ID=MMETSP0809-20121228/60605_1 /TAXON_ID=73025 ORGANISM="Eutreptiella gymnastica-like, Strain CCMP1594" /NCGR_SAMPLE_ID=MMETSP0809 /ASSEMBLY_ACC=CAM_ASM_000658 /LENGTH=672 /DNA_ID=CAMNT_0015410305 /DNA_START=50 /DNA_END=2068 /DNA_ORIENTATION=-